MLVLTALPAGAQDSDARTEWREIKRELDVQGPRTPPERRLYHALVHRLCDPFVKRYPESEEAVLARVAMAHAASQSGDLVGVAEQVEQARNHAKWDVLTAKQKVSVLGLEALSWVMLCDMPRAQEPLNVLRELSDDAEVGEEVVQVRVDLLKLMAQRWLVDGAEQELKALRQKGRGSQHELEEVERTLAKRRDLQIGTPAPEVAGKSLNGEQISLKARRGKPVVLSVDAAAAGPSQQNLEYLQTVREQYPADNVAMLTVALDSERGQLERYLATHHLAWPVIWVGNAEGKPVADLRVASPATVFVIDAEGIMRYRGPGGPAVDYWLEKLTR